MDISTLIFLFFAFISIVALGFLLITTNIVRAAFSFLIVLLGVAALFVLANAEFVAMVQILIYIGGILVLLLFGVMLTASYTHKQKDSSLFSKIVSAVFCFVLAYSFFFCLQAVDFQKIYGLHTDTTTIPYKHFTVTQMLGYLTLTEYILPFEMAGFLLLISLIGASVITFCSQKNIFLK